MEKVKEFIQKLTKGSRNAILSRIVILVSLIFIMTRDITMIVQIIVNSDDNQLLVGYCISFLTFQVLWSYSSWIMLLLFFYPDNDDLPNVFKDLKNKDRGYPMINFGLILEELLLCSKSQVKYNKNVNAILNFLK